MRKMKEATNLLEKKPGQGVPVVTSDNFWFSKNYFTEKMNTKDKLMNGEKSVVMLSES